MLRAPPSSAASFLDHFVHAPPTPAAAAVHTHKPPPDPSTSHQSVHQSHLIFAKFPVPSPVSMEAAGDQPQHPSTVDLATILLENRRRAYHSEPQQRQFTMTRVMRGIRQEDHPPYNPIVISFGPFHKDKPEVQAAWKFKWKFLENLLRRCPGIDLYDLSATITSQVNEFRWQYSEEFSNMTDADFVDMLVVDGCFMLELMIIKSDDSTTFVNLSGLNCQLSDLIHDMFLLENQIPFSVLETLYTTLSLRPSVFYTSLRRLTFLSLIAPGAPPDVVPDALENIQFQNILHFYHHYHVLKYKTEDAPPPRLTWLQATIRGVRKTFSYMLFQVFFKIICFLVSCMTCRPPEYPRVPFIIPSATKLMDAGITFRRKMFWARESHSDLKITFSPDGVFEIPPLYLHDHSISKYRNLIAFEQSGATNLPLNEHYYTSYCMLMSYLIDNEADLGVLVDVGIIHITRGSTADMAKLFKKVCRGAAVDHMRNCYLQVMDDVTQYRMSDRHKWRAKLARDYFGNPWMSIGAIIASYLICAATLQTVYTMLSYKRPPQ